MSVGKNMSMMVTTFFQIRPTVLHPLAVHVYVARKTPRGGGCMFSFFYFSFLFQYICKNHICSRMEFTYFFLNRLTCCQM